MGKIKEHRIESFNELRRILEQLDPDEGIRIMGSVNGFSHGGIIFVTRGDRGYYVSITDVDLDDCIPCGKEEWQHFTDSSEVSQYLKNLAKKPLRAWLY